MANEQPTTQLDPQSLVARIITELQANPEAQRLLWRALLTNEFLGMPARLDHIEKDVAEFKTDVGYLKGSDLESDLETEVHRRIVPMVSQHMRLRRVRIIMRALQQAAGDFDESLAQAAKDGRIGAEQQLRILTTDLILRGDRRPLWIAVQVANRIDVDNIVRSRESADALAEVFAEDAVGTVAGYRIDAADRERAATAGVRCLDVAEKP